MLTGDRPPNQSRHRCWHLVVHLWRCRLSHRCLHLAVVRVCRNRCPRKFVADRSIYSSRALLRVIGRKDMCFHRPACQIDTGCYLGIASNYFHGSRCCNAEIELQSVGRTAAMQQFAGSCISVCECWLVPGTSANLKTAVWTLGNCCRNDRCIRFEQQRGSQA